MAYLAVSEKNLCTCYTMPTPQERSPIRLSCTCTDAARCAVNTVRSDAFWRMLPKRARYVRRGHKHGLQSKRLPLSKAPDIGAKIMTNTIVRGGGFLFTYISAGAAASPKPCLSKSCHRHPSAAGHLLHLLASSEEASSFGHDCHQLAVVST